MILTPACKASTSCKNTEALHKINIMQNQEATLKETLEFLDWYQWLERRH